MTKDDVNNNHTETTPRCRTFLKIAAVAIVLINLAFSRDTLDAVKTELSSLQSSSLRRSSTIVSSSDTQANPLFVSANVTNWDQITTINFRFAQHSKKRYRHIHHALDAAYSEPLENIDDLFIDDERSDLVPSALKIITNKIVQAIEGVTTKETTNISAIKPLIESCALFSKLYYDGGQSRLPIRTNHHIQQLLDDAVDANKKIVTIYININTLHFDDEENFVPENFESVSTTPSPLQIHGNETDASSDKQGFVVTSEIQAAFAELAQAAKLYTANANSNQNKQPHNNNNIPPTKQKPRYAIAVYVEMDTHIIGLYSILKQAVNTGMVEQGIEMVVALTDPSLRKKDEHYQRMAQKLEQLQQEGLIHKLIAVDNRFLVEKVHNTGLWEGVFNKLIFYNYTEYDKIVRLDNDVFIRQNIRHWFDYETPCAIQAKDEMEWNSGAMVITPNATIFDDMMNKLPEVKKLGREDRPKLQPSDPDGWNSGIGEQGFLSSYFTTSTDQSQRMKTMSTGDAILISSLGHHEQKYFWYHRNHIFLTVHLSTEKPWDKHCRPDNNITCEVLREWALSAEGVENYLAREEHRPIIVDAPYLQNCPNLTSPVIPAYQRFPQPTR